MHRCYVFITVICVFINIVQNLQKDISKVTNIGRRQLEEMKLELTPVPTDNSSAEVVSCTSLFYVLSVAEELTKKGTPNKWNLYFKSNF
jgi:hypothetical protein